MTGVRRAGIRAVVFDLDGTLVDTMALVPRAYAETIRDLGGPTVSPDEVVAAWHVGPTPVVLAHFLRRAVTPDDIEHYFAHVSAAVDTVEPFPGVPEMLDALRREGYRLGVFTAATRRAATLMLAATGLDRYLPVVVGGDEASEPKPAPPGLRLACRRAGAGAAESAYVGDAEVDLRCARAAGSLGIHASWDGPAVAVAGSHLLARRPADVVDLLRGLPAGD